MIILNPRADGIFPDPANRWGGGVPPAICQTTGPILDPKKAFDSSGLKLSEYAAKFIRDVTDDVTGWVKGTILDFLPLLVSQGEAAVSNWNKAEERHGSCLGYLLVPPTP